MEYSPELLQFAKENMKPSQFTDFHISLEADGHNLDIHKGFLKKLTTQITSFFKSKPTRDKLFPKSIVDSNGDITKVKNIEVSLDVLKLLKKSKEKDIKEDALMLEEYYNNLKKRKSTWMKLKALSKKGGLFESTIADMMYNGEYVYGVRAFVAGVSQVLVRLNNPKVFKRRGTFSLLREIRKDNTIFQSGKADKAFNHLLKKQKSATEAIEVSIIVALGVIITLITLCFSIRIFTYYFYYTRMQLADYFEQQARFLDIHKSEIKRNSNLTQVEKNNIIDAQKGWAERFMAISEFIADDDIKAAKKTDSEVKKNNNDLNPSNDITAQNTGLDFF